MAEIIDNLGGYGQFTSAANSLIRSLEKTAVSNAAPGLRAQGGSSWCTWHMRFVGRRRRTASLAQSKQTSEERYPRNSSKRTPHRSER
ncbi:hypothetical protein HMPREF9156_00440 [Scardovia wiggsiae F0424]|uniref:Uncharacterized protein n=1 Tax=Scardovia wiggsiae F0424 TaxID=857290 RepID=J0X2P5_9BIFI|nr:hypothetical protein HMPREF9156_00440 [Scardovia wiggsiae F0424]